MAHDLTYSSFRCGKAPSQCRCRERMAPLDALVASVLAFVFLISTRMDDHISGRGD